MGSLGKYEGSSYYAGLVDSVFVSQFHERLDKCKGVWNMREAPFTPPSGPRFFEYFLRYKSTVVC